jgi:hypothetical protein
LICRTPKRCGRSCSLRPLQQLRQLGDVGGDAPRLVTGEQLASRPSARFVLTVDESQCLPVGVAHDETRSGFLDGPRRRARAAGFNYVDLLGRAEIDAQRDRITRLRENAEDRANIIQTWKEVFGMAMTEDGKWTWSSFWDEHYQTIEDYNALVRDWNKYLPRINGEPRNVGRPLPAAGSAGVGLVMVGDDMWFPSYGNGLRRSPIRSRPAWAWGVLPRPK